MVAMNRVLLLSAFCIAVSLNAQESIGVGGNMSTITFSGYAGSGFSPTPGAGQLDSDSWETSGFDETVSFGGTCTSGDCARGSSSGGVGQGGVYNFDAGGTGDACLGVQPTGSDFTSGYFMLQVQNNTGGAINQFSLSYDVYVRNDQPRGNSFNLSVASGTLNNPGSFGAISALDVTSPTASTGATWVVNNRNATITLGSSIPDGGYLFLRWTGDDENGGGSRDEFCLDNISITSAILPVELTNLSGKTKRETINITWATATELNNSHFEIERSPDGRNYAPIGRVQGNGTVYNPIDYTFIDQQPIPGLNYYRLKQVDYDGAFEYFGPIAVDFKGGDQDRPIKIYPTVVTDQLSVEWDTEATGDLSLTILDMNGRVMQERMLEEKSRTTQVPVGALPRGAYLLRWSQGNRVSYERFMKQ